MYTLLLGDSEVRRVWQEAGDQVSGARLAIELSAARVQWHEGGIHHRASTEGHTRPTEGYLKPLTLWLDHARWCVLDDPNAKTSTLDDCYGAITEGTIHRRESHDGKERAVLLRHVTLPLTLADPITLQLHMRARATWQFNARHIRIEPPPDAQFRESMAC